MKQARGFTLVEIVLVVVLLSAILGLALPRIRKTNTNIKSVMRELSVLSIEVRHYARLKNATYRIAFEMTGTEDSYSVEAANTAVMIKTEEKQKKEDSLSGDDKPKSAFQKVDKPLKSERKLPGGLFIKSVETSARGSPVTKGLAYIYYSPEGLVQSAVVQITDGKAVTWSLIFNPLTGHADIVDKAVALKELEVE